MALAGGLVRASDARAVDRATNTGNVALSTTAGTFTVMETGSGASPFVLLVEDVAEI